MGSRELLGATESDTVTVIGNVTIPGTTESVTVTITVTGCTEHYAVTVIGMVTIAITALSSSESVTQSSSLLKSLCLAQSPIAYAPTDRNLLNMKTEIY